MRAVHEGRVVFADRFRGYGLMVVVDHGGKHHSLYAQLARDRGVAGAGRGRRGRAGHGRPGGAGRAGRLLRDALPGPARRPADWLQPALRPPDDPAGWYPDFMSHRSRLAASPSSPPASSATSPSGSLLGRVLGDTSYGQLAIFNEVVRLVLDAYVEPVNLDRAMAGARLGMADALDGDSSYLDAEEFRLYQQPPEGGATPRSASC